MASYSNDTVWEKMIGRLLAYSMATVGITTGLYLLLETDYDDYIVAVWGLGVLGVCLSVVFMAYDISPDRLSIRSWKSKRIDAELGRLLRSSGRSTVVSLEKLYVFSNSLPVYRFVDLFQAIESYCNRLPDVVVVESMHYEDLNSILQSQLYGHDAGKMTPPRFVSRDIACKKQAFFPVDRFWVIGDDSASNCDEISIIRLREGTDGGAIFEIAALKEAGAEQCAKTILDESVEKSIYRGGLLSISFAPKVDDVYGAIDGSSPIQLGFLDRTTITQDDIVLDEHTSTILKRTIFDFYAQRETLAQYGVPLSRGLLFYGPPGTGKSYTCQFIGSELEDVTTLVVTGQSLPHVEHVCSLARMLQPSLVVLEDVDLVFAARDINLYSSALGELMDELDGFQRNDSVIFLLTTNSIERLESAIKDRPGRINQCIHFDLPNAELRQRYISRYVRDFDTSELALDSLVQKTRGTSQAFLKEVVYRAVQIALGDAQHNGKKLKLCDGDFDVALEELTRYGSTSTAAIMGFKAAEK